MNLRHTATAALGAAALMLLSGAAKAADTVVFAAAGSSAQFPTFTQAFLNQSYANHYSLGSNAAFQIVDPGAPNESAQVAIYWQGMPGAYQIAVFYQVDSTVGVRSFFNSDTLTAPTSLSAVPTPTNVGQPGSGDVVPPLEVLQAVNGAAVNVGATDITPEDALVATQRSLALGYNGTAPNPFKTGVSGATTVATPVPFSLTAKPFTLTPLGAVPVVVFVNNGPGFSALTGANLNIDSFTLAGYLSGQFTRTTDLQLASSTTTTAYPVHTYVREALSGTYNTMEYTNPESTAKLGFTQGRQSGSTGTSGGQELNVSSKTSNPLNEPASGTGSGPANSGRIRAIGTGQLVTAVNGDSTDALGYAFYAAGTFSGKTNLRYLTVDGADPIQDSYTSGSLTNATVTFRNIVNGGYPLWSILRVVTQQNPPAGISSIITAAQGANVGTDFVNANVLRVFRSYHKTPFTVGAVSDGNLGVRANGGDVGGSVFPINDDIDISNDFGGDLTNLRQ